MSSSDQNRGNDPEAEKLVREFEAYDFGNDGEFRVSRASLVWFGWCGGVVSVGGRRDVGWASEIGGRVALV